jgi:hypothetical protein
MNWTWNYVTFQRGTRLITGVTGSRAEEMARQDLSGETTWNRGLTASGSPQ